MNNTTINNTVKTMKVMAHATCIALVLVDGDETTVLVESNVSYINTLADVDMLLFNDRAILSNI